MVKVVVYVLSIYCILNANLKQIGWNFIHFVSNERTTLSAYKQKQAKKMSSDSNVDASENVKRISNKVLSGMFKLNASQCIAILRSLFGAGADETDVRMACEVAGVEDKYQTILPMCLNEATNATTATTDQQVTSTIQFLMPAADVSAVYVRNTILQQFFLWGGGFMGTFAEIGNGTMIDSPGYVGEGQAPALQQQLILGPNSQIKAGVSVTKNPMIGFYGVGAFLTPPKALAPPAAPFPDYGDSAWNTTVYTFNPGQLTPYTDPSANATDTTAVMVRFNQDLQARNSVNTAANYYMSRIIYANGDVYVTPTASGTTATGTGACALISDTRQSTFTQPQLIGQGGKNAVMVKNMNRVENKGGINMILGTNVLETLTPANLGYLSGGEGGVTLEPIYSTLLKATGLGDSTPNANCFQAPGYSQTGTSFEANEITDRIMGCYAQVLYVSDRFDTSSTYAQAPQLSSDQCLVGSTSAMICNLYPTTTFSQDSVKVMSAVKNVHIPLISENAMPVLKLRWDVSMGQVNQMSLGFVCHTYIQVTPGGSAQFASKLEGLGVAGLACGASGSAFPVTGVIPGGNFNSFKADVLVPVGPGDEGSNSRQWTWAGSYVMLAGMPHAAMNFSMNIEVPREYKPGVIGPALVTRLNGIGEKQQVVFRYVHGYEVIANPKARSIQPKGSSLLKPIINQNFPRLLDALFKSNTSLFFRLVMAHEDYINRLGKVLSLKTAQDVGRLIVGDQGVLDRAIAERFDDILDNREGVAVTPSEIRKIAGDMIEDAQASGMFGAAEAGGMYGDGMFGEGTYGRKRQREVDASFFGDLWGDIKKGASWVGDHVVAPVISDVGHVVGDVARDAVPVALGALKAVAAAEFNSDGLEDDVEAAGPFTVDKVSGGIEIDQEWIKNNELNGTMFNKYKGLKIPNRPIVGHVTAKAIAEVIKYAKEEFPNSPVAKMDVIYFGSGGVQGLFEGAAKTVSGGFNPVMIFGQAWLEKSISFLSHMSEFVKLHRYRDTSAYDAQIRFTTRTTDQSGLTTLVPDTHVGSEAHHWFSEFNPAIVFGTFGITSGRVNRLISKIYREWEAKRKRDDLDPAEKAKIFQQHVEDIGRLQVLAAKATIRYFREPNHGTVSDTHAKFLSETFLREVKEGNRKRILPIASRIAQLSVLCFGIVFTYIWSQPHRDIAKRQVQYDSVPFRNSEEVEHRRLVNRVTGQPTRTAGYVHAYPN